MNEAKVIPTENGDVATGEGWFVLNLTRAAWTHHASAGTYCVFEPEDVPFGHYGINVHIVMPGQANGRYHEESNQEDFLVLHGECIAIVEGQERRLKQWDFLHCPPGTRHIFVGTGDGPCAILMVGARRPDERIHYPVEPLAARYGASVKEPTDSVREAYADQVRTRKPVPSPWPLNA